MAFKDLVRDTLDAYHINTTFFGETVTYTPFGGTGRDIDVYLEFDEDIQLDAATEDRRQVIRVTCKRDGTDGINLPNIGDTIIRSITFDRDGTRPYVFEGELDNESRDHWRASFVRMRRDGQGF